MDIAAAESRQAGIKRHGLDLQLDAELLRHPLHHQHVGAHDVAVVIDVLIRRPVRAGGDHKLAGGLDIGQTIGHRQ